MRQHNYNEDVKILKAHTNVVELSDGNGAHVAVAPEWQGRVMTSTLDGAEGDSFGWLNRRFIASRKEDSKFNNYGGEDRFWLGPEAGQFGLWFQPGDKFTLDDFKTPAGFNTGPFNMIAQSARHVSMERRFEVANYSGTRFNCQVRRSIRLLHQESAATGLAAAIPAELNWVGFESVNALTNAGESAWQQERGLVCVWILGMFNPAKNGRVIVPVVPGPEARFGPVVRPYFGDIPDARLQVADDHAVFICDGGYRTKIGVSPLRARNAIGSWDPDARVLTIVTFNLPAAAHQLPYVNSQWEMQEDPFGGDVVNSYNDGRDPITGTVLGPFYELETSSPGAELAPGETLVHVHRTYHFTGDQILLGVLSRRVLGVDVTSSLQRNALPSRPRRRDMLAGSLPK